MADTDNASYQRLVEMLPDYACGVIWLVDIALIIAVVTTKREAIDASKQISAVIGPFHIPDVAVGFLLAIAGVMLPYSLGRALNPVAVVVLNAVRDWLYRDRPDTSVSDEHLRRFHEELGNRGLPVPVRSAHLAVMPYLIHTGSAFATPLIARRREFHEEAYLAFPVSLLVAVGVFAVLPGQGRGSILVAVVLGMIALALTIHRAQMALVRWHAEVMFAFLVIVNLPARRCGTEPDLGDARPNSR